MKKLMILGGLIGFTIGVTSGLLQGVTWPSLFWRASVASLAAGLLLRWWGRVWIRSLRENHEQRMTADTAGKATPLPILTK
jgi:hypothetical protein